MNNENEDNSPNILTDKNYQASSQKFRQIKMKGFDFQLVISLHFLCRDQRASAYVF